VSEYSAYILDTNRRVIKIENDVAEIKELLKEIKKLAKQTKGIMGRGW